MKDYSYLNKQCVAFNVIKLQRAVASLFNHELLKKNEIRLTIFHFTILLELTKSTQRNLTQLSAFLGMDRTTLLRNAQILLKYGYISWIRKDDKRSRFFEITERGLGILKEAIPVWEEVNRRFLEESKIMMGYKYKEEDTFNSQLIDDLEGIYQIAFDLKQSEIKNVNQKEQKARKYHLASLV